MNKEKFLIFSIVIPTYNEAKFLPDLINQLKNLKQHIKEKNNIELEIIFVDDGSTDSTEKICLNFDCVYIYQENQGKGNAVRNGVAKSNGSFVIVLDADMEYSPMDILKFIDLVRKEDGDIVIYGSRYRTNTFPYLRFFPYKNQSVFNLYFSHFLTALYFLKKRKFITDLLTGLKLYPTAVYRDISPKTNGFETDHEITLALARLQIPIREISINYEARTKADGKKIGASDAIKAIKILIK